VITWLSTRGAHLHRRLHVRCGILLELWKMLRESQDGNSLMHSGHISVRGSNSRLQDLAPPSPIIPTFHPCVVTMGCKLPATLFCAGPPPSPSSTMLSYRRHVQHGLGHVGDGLCPMLLVTWSTPFGGGASLACQLLGANIWAPFRVRMVPWLS
jgi:hypothetical protein